MKNGQINKIMGFAAVLIIIVCAVYCLPDKSDKTAPSAEQSTLPALHVEGTSIYNSDGEKICMRGVSYGWHNLWPRFYNQASVKHISEEWGVKIFRAAVGADDLHETGDNLGYISDPDNALKCLYAVVDGAIACGAYVIVDWHSHLLHPQQAEEFFRAVATRYARCPNVIYELFNEPVCRSNEEHRGYADLADEKAMMSYWLELKEYAESLIKTISSISTVHPLILMGNPCWDQRPDLCAAAPIEGYDNVAYTMHFYAASHGADLRERTESAIAAGIPIFISECAGCENTGDGVLDAEAWKVWSDWATGLELTMLTWSISDKVETCSMLIPGVSSEGPWSEEEIKPWGQMVKAWLRE